MITAPARTLYLIPEDDLITPLMKLVGGAKKRIHGLVYSLGYAPLVDTIIAKHVAGVDVRLVLDASESVQPFEAPLVAKLRDAGVPMVIGRSPKANALMHAKLLVIDGVAVHGSGNWTHAGLTAEVGVMTIERSKAVVDALDAFYGRMEVGVK